MAFDRGYVAGALQSPTSRSSSRGRAATNYAETGKNADTDQEKYQAAVAAARNGFSGRDDVSREEFKNAIDDNFAAYGGSVTGREMRGETPLSDLAHGINDFTRGVNVGIGNLLDAGFDNTVGNFAGLFDENLGSAVKNLATGEDLAVIPDIASDVLLSLPGWTVPLVIAKELARNSDDIHEAVSGKDSLTLEDLDAGQRAAKGFSSALGVGLSAIPGIGKIRSLAEVASKKGSKATMEAAEKAVKEKATAAEKELAEAKKKAPNLFEESDAGVSPREKWATEQQMARSQKLVDNWDSVKGQYDADTAGKVLASAKKNVEEGSKKLGEMSRKAEGQDLANTVRQAVLSSPTAMPANAELKLAQEALDSAEEFAGKSTAGRVAQIFGNDMRGYAQALRDIPQTWKKSRDVVKAERELLKAGRKANKDLRPFKKNTGVKTELDADARQIAMEDAVGGEEALKALLGTSGIGTVENLARKSGMMRTGLPIGTPQLLRSAGDVFSDVGLRGNSGLSYARGLTDMADQQRFWSNLAKYEELQGKKNSPLTFLQRAAVGTPQTMMNPTNAASNVKNTLLGTGMSLAAMPAGYMAEYGGDAPQAFAHMADDLDNGRIRPGAFLSAFFPVGSQRYLAQSAIPGVTGKLNSYHPYAALRAKDVENQFEDLSEEASFGNALENVKSKEKKNGRQQRK